MVNILENKRDYGDIIAIVFVFFYSESEMVSIDVPPILLFLKKKTDPMQFVSKYSISIIIYSVPLIKILKMSCLVKMYYMF